MKKTSLYLKIVALTLFSVFMMSPVAVGALNKDAVCEGAGLAAGSSTGCTAPEGTSSVNDIVRKGLNLFSAVIGVIAVVMIMVGGIQYIISQGDPGKTATAKNTLLYAAIGLVVVALSQIFVQFVLKRFAG